MEGKEVRFGIANSALFTTITTDASCGAVNNMHDSLMPLGGMVPMVNIMLGEIIFGGVGSGPLRHDAVRHRGDVRRRADGGPHAGIHRQEAGGQGSQDGHAGHPDPAAVDAGLHRPGGGDQAGPGRAVECRPARLLRGAVCLCLGHRQQWQRLRRPVRQHAVLELDVGPGDVHRAAS